MVGVAVAMVIPTMHEKSCIELHNAQKFKKYSKIQSFKYLAITMMESWNYHRYRFPGLSQLYDAIILQVISYTTNKNSYLKQNQFHLKLSAHNLQNELIKLFTIYSQNHA